LVLLSVRRHRPAPARPDPAIWHKHATNRPVTRSPISQDLLG